MARKYKRMKVFPEGSFEGHAGSLPDIYKNRDDELSIYLKEIDQEDEKESNNDRTVTQQPQRPLQASAIPIQKEANAKRSNRVNKTKLPRIRKLSVTPGIKEMKVKWEIFPNEEFPDILYIIQWRKSGERKGWRRGESTKLSYIIKNLAPETEYEVKVSALWEKIISPAEQVDVKTEQQEDVSEEEDDDEYSLVSPRLSPVTYAQRKICVMIINDYKDGLHAEQSIKAKEIYDFFDKTLRFKTVIKLENQPREKVRDWFKALDRSKMFDGFEMFVCVVIGFGNYHGIYGSDGEMVYFHEIYKHTKAKFGNKPKVILVDIKHLHSTKVPSMKNADVRVVENSSREVLLEWTPPRYLESDNVQFLIECFKGLQKIVEVVQPNTRLEFDNLEPNTFYRFHVTPVQGNDRKPHGNSVYAKLKTKANVKDTDILEVRSLCAQRISGNEISVFWEPPDIRKTNHLSYVISWTDQTTITKRSEKETKKTSCVINGLLSNSEQVVKVTVKAYDKLYFPVSHHVPNYQDVLRPTHVAAIAESHSVFWVDWQFPIDKQDLIEKFTVFCAESLSFRKNRTKSFDVEKECRSLPVNYIPELSYHYVRVVPITKQDSTAEKVQESVISRIETDKALRLFASSKSCNSCELIWWVDVQDREMVSTYTAHCKPTDASKKQFKPVPLRLGPACRQLHEIVNLESDTVYHVSIYKHKKMYTQQIKVRTLPKGNPENLDVTVLSSFEVIVTWSHNFKSEGSESTYIVEYKCDPTIMKRTVRLEVSDCSVNLTELLPDVQYEVLVKNKEKGDPSITKFKTPQFGPTKLDHKVTASEINLTWETPVLPKDYSQPLQYQVILERNDGNRRKGKVVENKTSRFKCDFKNLWSSTVYIVRCFTLIDGKRKYAPVVIKTKTKNDHLRRLLEPRGDNFIISFASCDVATTADAPLQSGLYMSTLFLQFRDDLTSKSVDELVNDINRKKLTSYAITNINYSLDKVMFDSPKATGKET